MGEMDPTSRRANQLFNGDAAESGASLTALRTTTIMPGVSNVGSITNLACKLCQKRDSATKRTNVKRSEHRFFVRLSHGHSPVAAMLT